MIPSRKVSDVEKWLKTYPNIVVVSRDGSISYRTAIEKALLDALQVSDRFHIIKNFTESCRSFLLSYFKPKVLIEDSKLTSTTDKEEIIVLTELARSKLQTLRDKLIAKSNGQKLEWVNRKFLIKLCFKDFNEKDGLTEDILRKIFKRYPVFQKLFNLIVAFKSMFKNKKHFELEKWLNKLEKLNKIGLNSFAEGVRRDIEAVKNAIAYQYNNGLAEGHINKIKLIKRIMYGKCGFNTLRNKVLLINQWF
jgi:transposase